MLYANLAPEPGDILWENLDVTFTKRMKNVLLTWLVTLIALGISFGMVYGCSLW